MICNRQSQRIRYSTPICVSRAKTVAPDHPGGCLPQTTRNHGDLKSCFTLREQQWRRWGALWLWLVFMRSCRGLFRCLICRAGPGRRLRSKLRRGAAWGVILRRLEWISAVAAHVMTREFRPNMLRHALIVWIAIPSTGEETFAPGKLRSPAVQSAIMGNTGSGTPQTYLLGFCPYRTAGRQWAIR